MDLDTVVRISQLAEMESMHCLNFIYFFVQEAARYRDELNKVSPPKVDFGLQCYCDTITKVHSCDQCKKD